MEVAPDTVKTELQQLMQTNPADKVERVLAIFRACKVDEWAQALKTKFYETALQHLEDTAVLTARKKPMQELAAYLMVRES